MFLLPSCSLSVPSVFPGASPLCRLCVSPPLVRDSCTVPGNAARGGAALSSTAGVFCNCLWPSLTHPLLTARLLPHVTWCPQSLSYERGASPHMVGPFYLTAKPARPECERVCKCRSRGGEGVRSQMWESVTRGRAALLSPNSPLLSLSSPRQCGAEPPHLLYQFCPPPNPACQS